MYFIFRKRDIRFIKKMVTESFPNHITEKILGRIGEFIDYIKVIPIGIDWNTAIDKIKINPNVVTTINPETGLPTKLRFGVDFNIILNTPIAERISIHEGNDSRLHHGVEASIKQRIVKCKI